MSNEKGYILYLKGYEISYFSKYGMSSPKAYGFYKVTASKFIVLRLWRWENLITFKYNIFFSEKCAGKLSD